jgi:Tfp pilus assembly protein PilN
VYIKINLLPKDLRPKKILIKFDYRAILILLVIAAAIGLGAYYMYIQQNLSKLNTELTTWEQAEKALQKTVDLQNEVIALRGEVGKRVNIIKKLTSDSDLRFSMLQNINAIIPENLWLLRIRETSEENKIFFSIEGMSYTKQGISTFLASLEKYDKFVSVALESIRPAPLEIRDAYEYSVKVQLKTEQPVVEEEKAKDKDKKAPKKPLPEKKK